MLFVCLSLDVILVVLIGVVFCVTEIIGSYDRIAPVKTRSVTGSNHNMQANNISSAGVA